MKTLKRYRQRYVIATAVISLSAALAVFLPPIIQDRGFFLIVGDYNAQALPFATAVRYALYAKPLGEWFWGIDLGTSLIDTFGFYNLGSPFFWVSVLFPNVQFPYLASWLYILKYVVAAVTAHLYLRRFTSHELYALIGALLYAFSGFQSTNLLFFHFHDVTAFFPLLLLTLEQTMEDRRYRPRFILAVFLDCLVNYFFFVGEVLFVIVYFVVRFRREPHWIKAALGRLLDGLFGVGMAFALFLPSVLYVLESDRSTFSLTWENAFYSVRGILFVLKGLFLPGDLMNDSSALILETWRSTAAYLPVFGLSFVFAYLFRQKGWLRLMIVLGLIVSLFPCMQAAFYLFADVYQRWWYMLILLMALATVKVLEQPEAYPIGRGVLLNGGIVAGLVLAVLLLNRNTSNDPYLFHSRRFYAQALAAAGAPAAVWVLLKLRLLGKKRIAALTMAGCVLTSAFALYGYRKLNTNETYREFFIGGQLMETLDEQYRYRATGMLMTTNGQAAAYIGFCSTLENASYAFNELFDIHSTNMTRDRSKVRGLPALLGAKFSTTGAPSEEDHAVAYIDHNGTVYYLITYSETCPIGFAVDQYQTEEQLTALPVNERACALMHAFLINPEEIEAVRDIASPFDAGTVDLKNTLDASIEACKEQGVSDFHRDNTGFRCTTSYDRDRMVYFTVPYDRGWHATVDGEPAQILYSGGMMLLRVPAGEHAVSFVYHTPGFRFGLIVTAACWTGFIVYCVLISCKRKRQKDAETHQAQP